jgi:hypothetical protein
MKMGLFGKKKDNEDDIDKMEKEFSYGDKVEERKLDGKSGKGGYGTSDDDDDESTVEDIYNDGESKVRKVRDEDGDPGFYLKPWELAVIIIEIILFLYTLLVLLNIVPII